MERPSTPRRYSRAEMNRILEEATRASPDDPPSVGPGEGLTLAEIQAIGAEVGIDPRRIARAASVVDLPPTPPAKVAFGTYQAERSVPGRLDDAQVDFVLREADRYFGVRGTVRRSGAYAEWYSRRARAFVGVVGEGDATRMRVIVDRAPEFYGGAALLGVMGFIPSMLALLGQPGGSAGAALAIAVSLVTLAAILGLWHTRGRRVQGEAEELLDLLAHALPPSG